MRLVIEYSEGDGHTYCCTNTFPIEYESAEQLLVDIEHACAEYLLKEKEKDETRPEPKHKQTDEQYLEKMTAWMAKYPYVQPEMRVGGRILWLTHFIENGVFVPPYIYTIDEWFNAHEQ